MKPCRPKTVKKGGKPRVIKPTIIKKKRAAFSKLLRADVDHGGAMSLIFDETTDFCGRRPVNIIVHIPEYVCYTSTAFIFHKEAVNNLCVALLSNLFLGGGWAVICAMKSCAWQDVNLRFSTCRVRHKPLSHHPPLLH